MAARNGEVFRVGPLEILSSIIFRPALVVTWVWKRPGIGNELRLRTSGRSHATSPTSSIRNGGRVDLLTHNISA
jgi:hypothetical protein